MAKTCPSCGYNPIGPYTDNCPICAEPVRGARSGRSRDREDAGPAPGLSPLVRWIVGGSLVALFAFAGCCGLGAWRGQRAVRDFEQQMTEAKAKAEIECKARTVTVTAAQLLQEFQTDPAAADRKYKHKYLEIGGVVERNGTDREDDTPFLVLHAGDDGAKLRVECFFELADDEEEAELKRLKKGDKITVRGEYSGQVSNVQVRDCVLAK